MNRVHNFSAGPCTLPLEVLEAQALANLDYDVYDEKVFISNGKLNLGTWQGIYLCEHRNNASKRRIVITVVGS